MAFRLETFGGLALVSPTTSSGVHQRLMLALLALLAATERGLSRDQIIAVLWPDKPADSARHSLDHSFVRCAGPSAALYSRVWIVGSGFPALRFLPDLARRAQLDGYLHRIVDQDFERQGLAPRKRETLLRWMSAYAAATSTTASLATIRDAATGRHEDKPAKETVQAYREILEQLWVLDPVPDGSRRATI